jgi:molecular chaperone DnaK
VGGQTRAPKVAEVVRRVFGKDPNRAVNPDEGVAVGAAIQTGILQGEVKDLVLLDVTPHTLGIETKDGTFTAIIDRNSTIPTRRTRPFTTVADNQTRVEIHILQGESDMAAYNRSLARFELTNIAPATRGVPQIDVSFEIDADGIYTVSALDHTTGRVQQMIVRPSSGLSQAEVGRMEAEAKTRDAVERAHKEREVLTQRIEGLMANMLRSVQLIGETTDEIARVLSTMTRIRAALQRSTLEELRTYLAELEEGSNLIGRALLGAAPK